jgi:hypothetical protein
MRPIVAEQLMPAPASAVFGFLADLENHARLAPGSVDVLGLERGPDLQARALVRLTGPLGIRRSARTELRPHGPESVSGRAMVGPRTRVSVEWTIERRDGGSFVSLCASVDAASVADGLLLRLGGGRWLLRQFGAALDRLAAELAAAPVADRGSYPVGEPSLSAARP